MKKKNPIYFGRNILQEAIQAGAVVEKIFIENPPAFEFVDQLLKKTGAKLGRKDAPLEILKGLPPEVQKEAHQGVAFESSHPFYTRYDFERLKKHQFVILCNHIEDVHNLGSIARCAAAFGASLIVHEEKQSASVTPAVVKASAGCAFRVKFMKSPDLLRVIQALEQLQFKIAGLDLSERSLNLYDWKPKLPLGLVLGAEGEGIEEVIQKRCQELIKIPLQTGVDSLNVSHAAGVALSWAHRQFHS